MRRLLLTFALFAGLAASARELPLPAVPDTLTTVESRADYVMLHFWDGMDFADADAVADEEFMAQNFANFASLFPLASEPGAEAAVRALLSASAGHEDAAYAISDLAEGYLLGGDSPVRSDDMYVMMARAMLAMGYPGAVRTRWLLEMASMNRPGSEAPDFTYVGRDGAEHRLSEHLGQGRVLLLFYNPTCHDCSLLIGQLQASGIASGMQAVAICPGEDCEDWDAIHKIPSGWVDGYAITPALDDLYLMPQMPTLYLIGPDGRIILKDARLPDLR